MPREYEPKPLPRAQQVIPPKDCPFSVGDVVCYRDGGPERFQIRDFCHGSTGWETFGATLVPVVGPPLPTDQLHNVAVYGHIRLSELEKVSS